MRLIPFLITFCISTLVFAQDADTSANILSLSPVTRLLSPGGQTGPTMEHRQEVAQRENENSRDPQLAPQKININSVKYETDDIWKTYIQLMKISKVLDAYADRIIAAICSSGTNKSVLLVGEPSNTYRYIFARVAAKPFPANCRQHVHAELLPNKIQGSARPGQTEKIWSDFVGGGAYGKDAVLYLNNIDALIGVGTHSNQATGIESEFAAAVDGGKLKSVAYIDKYSFEELNKSRHAYVLNAFGTHIKITNMNLEDAKQMVRDASSIFGQNIDLSENALDYLGRITPYFLPNTMDPQRSLEVFLEMVNIVGDVEKPRKVDFDLVRRAALTVAQVPRWFIDRDYKVISDFPANLDKDVIGVFDGKRDIVKQVEIGYVAGRTDEKPAGSVLLAGPTGTGKSYIAKKTAEYLDLKLITMDMTQYGDPETFDRFVDIMSKNLILYPYAVYLFEEIDKADVRILDRLYFILDEGIFYDKAQRKIFARGAFILMTTNQGYQVVIDNKDKSYDELEPLVNKELQKLFRPSFLNRFDRLAIFKPFTDEEYKLLAARLLSKSVENQKLIYDRRITVSDEVVEYCAKNGQSKLYGARPMERVVNDVVSTGLSYYTLQKEPILFGSKVKIEYISGNKFTIQVDKKPKLEYEVDLGNNSGN